MFQPSRDTFSRCSRAVVDANRVLLAVTLELVLDEPRLGPAGSDSQEEAVPGWDFGWDWRGSNWRNSEGWTVAGHYKYFNINDIY